MSPASGASGPGTTLAVGLVDPERRALGLHHDVHTVTEADLAVRLTRESDPVDLVVLGAAVERPVLLAQLIQREAPLAAVLVLTEESRDARVRREMSYAPGVPVDIEIVSDLATAGILVGVLAAQGAERRHHRATMAAVSLRPSSTAHPERPVLDLGPVLEHAPVGVLVCEPDGVLRGWNQRAATLLGLRAVAPRPMLADVLPDALELMVEGSEEGGDGVFTTTSSGRELEATAVPTQLDENRVGVLLLLVDVTDQRLAERERERLSRQMDLLSQVSETLITTLDVEEAMEHLADLLVPEFADWASLQLSDSPGADLSLVAMRHRDPAKLELLALARERQQRFASDEAPSRVAARRKQPMLLKEVDQETLERMVTDEQLREMFVTLGLGSVIAVPLPGRNAVLGSMVLIRTPESQRFTETDLVTAIEAGRRAGVALDNARLYSRQYDLSTELQRSLLTDPPALAHGDIAVRYVAASDEAQVGGDWYDAFVQPDGGVVLVVGDVMGHDRRAAAGMSQVRGVLRGIGYTTAADPAQMLTRVDQAMTGLMIPTLATAVVMRLAPGVGAGDVVDVEWSSAGHPAPVVLEASGQARVLGDGSSEADLLLGLDPGASRTRHSSTLSKGSTLLLFSDGLVERRGEGLDEGVARLLTLLEAGPAGESLEALCDRVLAAILPAGQEDDVVLAAMRLHP